jgi:hypothetical protein
VNNLHFRLGRILPSLWPDKGNNPPLQTGRGRPRLSTPARKNLKIEQPPFSAFDDSPVFDEISAGVILGLSPETLKKWRQRNTGPDYIQYGHAGPVRYELNALMEFRARNTVKTKQKK